MPPGVRHVTRALLSALTVALAVVLGGLAACDRPKPRDVPPDPFAVAPAQPAPVAPTGGLSAGLPKRPELAGFSLDRIGAAPDPLNKQPAATPAAEPIVLDGFGFDPVAKAPAKGVDIAIDGKAYATAYGGARPDVASYFKAPSLTAVGFSVTLPAASLPPGQHTAVVRVVAADGKAYFESPTIRFETK